MMKKILVVFSLAMLLCLLISCIAMADEEVQTTQDNNRCGRVIVKVGVFIPTDNQFDTLTSTNWTLEGEYVFYSTEYVDFSAVAGYFRTGLPNVLYKGLGSSINSFYYMGGAKFYPMKKDLYIGGFVGGVSNWVSPDPAPLSSSSTGLGYKACVGYEIKDNMLIELSYIAQSTEDLTRAVNWNPQRTVSGPTPYIMGNNSGIQIMGGYKF